MESAATTLLLALAFDQIFCFLLEPNISEGPVYEKLSYDIASGR